MLYVVFRYFICNMQYCEMLSCAKLCASTICDECQKRQAGAQQHIVMPEEERNRVLDDVFGNPLEHGEQPSTKVDPKEEKSEPIPSRTLEEIKARLEARKSSDSFAHEWSIYLAALPFDEAKQYLKPSITTQTWKQKTAQDFKQEAINYLHFAWEKANDQRGLSAQRSIAHFIAWLWLMGYNEFDDLFDEYELYGKPQLRRISEFLGVDWKPMDEQE